VTIVGNAAELQDEGKVIAPRVWMNYQHLHVGALVAAGSLLLVSIGCSASADTMTPQELQERYGIHDAYDGTALHPDGHRSSAVPVTMDDGRTGEFVIPSDRRETHPVYYRDDESGDVHPVRIDPRAARPEFVQQPHAVRYEAEPEHRDKPSWEKDALIVGGSAGGGALIGALAGGKKGAGVGAAAGGVGGLIYDLATRK
jgi:hypothetical protein